MRKVFVLMLVLMLSISCVSKKEHDILKMKYDSLISENKKLRAENLSLKNQLDEIKYGAERLLKNAKNLMDSKKYEASKKQLTELVKRHPASNEGKEGGILLKRVEVTIQKIKNEKELAKKKVLENATKKMRKGYDKVDGITWYHDKNTTRFINTNSFHIYIGKRSHGKPWIVLKIQYAASDWLFIEKFEIKAAGRKFTIHPSYGEIKRDNSAGKIWEWYQDIEGNRHLALIKAIISSKEAIIRYVGKDYTKDRTITIREKRALKNVLEALDALGG